jgi:hypothetical protein
MILPLIVTFVVVSIISSLFVGKPDQEQAYAQPQVTNFTKLFSANKDFLQCQDINVASTCVATVDVLYEDPTLLVLKSEYIDAIWKGVAAAQKEGYQIDSVTSYDISGGGGLIVNLIVAMSK